MLFGKFVVVKCGFGKFGVGKFAVGKTSGYRRIWGRKIPRRYPRLKELATCLVIPF